MDFKQRAETAVAQGKFKSIEAWAAAVCVSDDPRVPKEMRDWAHKQLTASLGNRTWIWLIAAKRDRGDKLAECQIKAVKQLYDEGSVTKAGAGGSQSGEVPE